MLILAGNVLGVDRSGICVKDAEIWKICTQMVLAHARELRLRYNRTMTAAKLRKTATILRTRALSVPPGPWLIESDNNVVAIPINEEKPPRIVHADTPEIAEFIAIASPPLLLAVAEWLDHKASVMEDVELSEDFKYDALGPARHIADLVLQETYRQK